MIHITTGSSCHWSTHVLKDTASLGVRSELFTQCSWREKGKCKKKTIQVSLVQKQKLQTVVPLRRREHDEDNVGNSDDQCLILIIPDKISQPSAQCDLKPVRRWWTLTHSMTSGPNFTKFLYTTIVKTPQSALWCFQLLIYASPKTCKSNSLGSWWHVWGGPSFSYKAD